MKLKKDMIKKVVCLVVTVGVGKVVDDIIAGTSKPETQLFGKVLRKIGSYSLSAVIGDVVGSHASEMVGETMEAIEEGVREGLEEENEPDTDENENDISKEV